LSAPLCHRPLFPCVCFFPSPAWLAAAAVLFASGLALPLRSASVPIPRPPAASDKHHIMASQVRQTYVCALVSCSRPLAAHLRVPLPSSAPSLCPSLPHCSRRSRGGEQRPGRGTQRKDTDAALHTLDAFSHVRRCCLQLRRSQCPFALRPLCLFLCSPLLLPLPQLRLLLMLPLPSLLLPS
jgi:hypothetical protein